MRFIHLYLAGYFALVIGAGLALWQAGVVQRLPAIWILLALVIVVGLGVLLPLTASRPTVRTPE